MSISDFVKTNIHGSFVLADGAGTPTTHTSLYDLGDLTISGLGEGGLLNVAQHFQRRGKYLSSAYGERMFPTVSFSAFQTGTAGSAPGSIADWVLRKTPYASLVSTLGTGRVWASKCTINIEGTDFGDAADGQIILNSVIWKLDSWAEAADGNKFSISGTVMGPIEGDLAVAEYA